MGSSIIFQDDLEILDHKISRLGHCHWHSVTLAPGTRGTGEGSASPKSRGFLFSLHSRSLPCPSSRHSAAGGVKKGASYCRKPHSQGPSAFTRRSRRLPASTKVGVEVAPSSSAARWRHVSQPSAASMRPRGRATSSRTMPRSRRPNRRLCSPRSKGST